MKFTLDMLVFTEVSIAILQFNLFLSSVYPLGLPSLKHLCKRVSRV